MPGQLLIEYLDRSGVDYVSQPHSVAYTAQEIAQSSHIQGRYFAKVVMIKINNELAMMVLPAHYQVDFDELGCELCANNIVLATEREFSRRFPRCEIGAMPPFGHLYGLQTFMAATFPVYGDIAFNAGSHSEIIRMSVRDYMRLAFVSIVSRGVVAPQYYLPEMLAQNSMRKHLRAG